MKTKSLFLNKLQRASLVLILIGILIVSISALAGGGTMDLTFGTYGVVATDLGGSSDTGVNLVLQPDGKIIMASFNGSASCAITSMAHWTAPLEEAGK